MKRTHTPRRSSAEWQRLIDQHQRSGLSAAHFCRDHQLPYASFCKWRSRLTALAETKSSQSAESTSSGFIDLSQRCPAPMSGWEITLHLGDGVTLQLRRP